MIRKTVTIGNKTVGDGYPCFIIAEIGINHEGSLGTAKQMVDAAVGAGALNVAVGLNVVGVVMVCVMVFSF